MKNHTSWKRAAWWVAGLAVLACIIGSGDALWVHRSFLRPVDAVGGWTLVSAAAASVSALGAVAVAAIAFRGLRSLKLTRAEMVNRATRDAKLIAISRLEELAKELIPMNAPILDAMAQHKVQVFVKRSADVRFDPDPTDLREARAWVHGLPAGLRNEITTFLNRLEAWSVYFTTGVADDGVAFGPVAPLLRSWVGQYYPVLLLARADGRSGTFPNLVMLYTVWSNKMDAQQLAMMHQDMVAQLEHHRSNLARGPKLPGPFGAEIEE